MGVDGKNIEKWKSQYFKLIIKNIGFVDRQSGLRIIGESQWF